MASNGIGAGPGITKSPTGIRGFDEITHGGLPHRRTSLVLGSPGTGKTIFALQTLAHGARQRSEPGIFVAFEEPSCQIVENATFGWGLDELSEKELFFLDARLSPDTVRAGAFDLAGMLATLRKKAEQMGAAQIVFDSFDVMLRLIDDPARQRQEVYRIHDWLSRSDLTGIITARIDESTPTTAQYGFLPFIADCVVSLSHQIDERVSLRSLRVIKYRGSDFQENAAPLLIGPAGIEVASVGPSAFDHSVANERVSTGVADLDDMLKGGFFRGSTTLITGAPGTAKTTLSGRFAEAACQRGKRAVYVCFDQSAEETVRDLRSVNIDLQPHVDSGRLRMISARAEIRSADEHLLGMRNAIDEHEPHCMVIDPLSAILKAGGAVPALSVARRLIYHTKQRGVTLLYTSLLEGNDPTTEGTPLEVSTLADTWIHLSYEAQQGERNRTLSIVKSRGTGHSNQVRELILSDGGIRLMDVYTAGGEVLMGTLRWERERQQQAERARARAELERKRQTLKLAEAEAEARKRAIEREIEARRMELDALQSEAETREEAWHRREAGTRRRRNTDDPRNKSNEQETEDGSSERGVEGES